MPPPTRPQLPRWAQLLLQRANQMRAMAMRREGENGGAFEDGWHCKGVPGP